MLKSGDHGQPIDIEIEENIIVDRSKGTHSYEASLITSFIRSRLLSANQTFSFETVMSHHSKLQEIRFAKANGYKTYLYFICLDDPSLNISRVQNRVAKGGHPVPEEKIRRRYIDTLNNLYDAIRIADKSFLFDNSEKMELIAEVQDGKIDILKDEEFLPNWFIQYIINKLS